MQHLNTEPGFWHFGYGSNMALVSLHAKGVAPRASERAILRGWRLRFNVRHFFRHEGGVANIEETGDASDVVWGVVHLCEDADLALIDAAEAYGYGYDRVEVSVETASGERRALAYTGRSEFLDKKCRPTQRYLNIMMKGAGDKGIDPAYIENLRRHPVHEKQTVPPFKPPPPPHGKKYRDFTAATLTQNPSLTALAGSVFDMSRARWPHTILQGLFGGKDMTLYHLMRLHDAEDVPTLEDIKHDPLRPAQRVYLNEYLNEYAVEYVYVGRYLYDQPDGVSDS